MFLKKIIKNKSTYMVVIFALIIFTFSMCTSILTSKIRHVQELNGISNGKSIYFNFQESKDVTFNKVVENIKKYSNTYLEFNPVPIYLSTDTIFGKAIYFNYDLVDIPPLLEGNYIEKNDVENNNPVVVIGNDLLSLTSEIQGEKYLKIENKDFKVIGILGYKDKKSAYDKQFIFNMTALNYHSDNRAQWKLITKDKVASNLTENLSKNLNNKIIEKEAIYKFDLKETFSEMSDFINLLIIVLIIGIINIFVLTLLWINGYEKEIGIRKSLGATNLNIAIKILGQYILIVLISAGFGTILHYMCKNILDNAFPILAFDISLINIIIITLLAFIIGFLTAIVPIIKSIKLPPAITMKGGK